MLEITVTARQGLAEANGVATRFDADGGTIGRADTNRLVLDDPDRTVSRVHAQVVCKDGLYAIIDRGSNPMQLNGHPLGTGSEAPLNLGDRLTIGGFELVVSQLETGDGSAASALPAHAASAPATDDPFADLLEGLVPPAASPQKPLPASPVDEGPFPDPLGMSSSAPSDPFADLLGSGPDQGSPATEERQPDDFSDLITPARSPKAESIDALFGLGTPSGSDPLAMTPLADPLLQPNTASSQDPLAALSQEAPLRPPVRSDHLPVGQFGFVPPQSSAAQHSQPTLEAIDPFAGLADPAPPPARPAVPPPQAIPQPSKPDAAPPTQAPASPASQAADHELLAAFLRGLGPLQQSPAQLTPGLMERVGEMLRTSTEGTLQLLLTRQEFKKEVRAQATMIAAQANNPLKFSPTVEVALAHLLGPGMRGFMPAQAAMRDAYQDLRAHEFGVMVGMRAALAHVIERFEPSELEKNIAAKSKLDAIFSANRKAKLWDQFVALYGSIAKEAEDDFHSLFGKAFLKAYEEQMERLKAHDANGSQT
ncbi:MAG: type VI secretion system-associated FHA domain protein TagH [Ottowia sp.]|uniref:type VI secretion system-associated FHA domain protein TagH n=1 Tax=unclassified Ottowia TaxID=2645081 RepID=UPI003C2BE30C